MEQEEFTINFSYYEFRNRENSNLTIKYLIRVMIDNVLSINFYMEETII